MIECIAYEELKPGDAIKPGDEWQNDDGRWHPLALTTGVFTQVRDGIRARRPHNITALQKERDEFQTALIESRLALKRKVTEVMEVCKERDDALAALKSAQRARDELQLQVDELRADRERLQGLIDNLLDEPTARQVQDMLCRWATELDWSAGCFDSIGHEKVSAVQRVLVSVMGRIGSMFDAENSRAND